MTMTNGISVTTATEKKKHIPCSIDRGTLVASAVNYLTDHPVMKVKDFDQTMHDIHEWVDTDYLPLIDERGRARKRLTWEDAIDWVKSDLTRRSQTEYFRLDGEDMIVFLPTIGFIESHGGLCEWVQARRVIRALVHLIR
jgi:hypothetical protein